MGTLPPESELYASILARLSDGEPAWPLLATLAGEYGLLAPAWQIPSQPSLEDVARLLDALAGVGQAKAEARYKKLAAARPTTIAVDFGAYLHDAVKWRQSRSRSSPSSSSAPATVFARTSA